MIKFISTCIILCFISSSANAFNLLCEGRYSSDPEKKSVLFLHNNTNEVISIKGFNYVRHEIKYINRYDDNTVYDLYQIMHTDLSEGIILTDGDLGSITQLREYSSDSRISFLTTMLGDNLGFNSAPDSEESYAFFGGVCVKISDKLNEELMSFDSGDLSKFITDKTDEEIKSFESSKLIEFIKDPTIHNLIKLY